MIAIDKVCYPIDKIYNQEQPYLIFFYLKVTTVLCSIYIRSCYNSFKKFFHSCCRIKYLKWCKPVVSLSFLDMRCPEMPHFALPTIIFIIFWDFFIFYQIFLSPRVKRSAIISNKHGIHELPHELPNNLKLKEIRKYQENLKTS